MGSAGQADGSEVAGKRGLRLTGGGGGGFVWEGERAPENADHVGD